jgi:hypothetical protein
MRVLLPGLVGLAYIVKFLHIQENLDSENPVRHTQCKILQAEEGKEDLGYISIGYSRCHPNDNFNKEIGRQLALKKALEDGEFTKEARTHFWNEYRNWGKQRF